jgi:predicted ATP-grasp superfamily ATP-dependent carboligase
MIKEVNTPKLKNPIFIAAWPGMGEVAYRCALFLKEVMGFKMFAKLESSRFFKPAVVLIEKGVLDLPTIPAGFFYYLKGKNFPDIILFLGEAQPPLEYAEAFSGSVIDFVRKYKASFVLTFAAKPEPIDHRIDPAVWLAASSLDVLTDFAAGKVKIMQEGQISGLNGIILGVAKRKKINGACLLAEIPFYTAQVENPKATLAILQVINSFYNLNLNLMPMIERSKFIEEEVDKLISYLKGEPVQGAPMPLNEEDIEKIKKDLAAFSKLPQSAIEGIEKMFKEAQSDVAIASKLKAELDRWNVYKEYEDRFLDLFRKRKDGDISQ